MRQQTAGERAGQASWHAGQPATHEVEEGQHVIANRQAINAVACRARQGRAGVQPSAGARA